MPHPSKSFPRIELIVAEPDCRLWLGLLVRCLEQAGCAVGLEVEPHLPGRASALTRIARIEAAIYRQSRNLWEPLPRDERSHTLPAGDRPVRIALSGAGTGADLAIWLDSEQGIGTLGARMISGHVPLVEIFDREGQIRAAGLPAIEEPGIFARALDQVARRLATLILMALDGHHRHQVSPEDMREPPTERGAIAFIGSTLTQKVVGRVAGGIARKDHWRVGIRPARAPFQWIGDQHIDGFTWLPDDGERYYADPVLWHEDGRDYLFVEEFPYATGRGIIAYTELDEHGRPKFALRPVISRQTHLSYPLMFRHEGATYMIPENAAENHLPLYRATSFPEHWEECEPLVSGTGLHDATLLDHDGAWWLLANEAREGGSSWDCLCLYRAPSPLGPFVPHPANPLLVDARLARSGGPIIKAGGKLIRPVQNCLGGYGRFLRFTEITMLSGQGFQQHETGRILPRKGSRIAGVHSYGRNARFEVIDALTTRRWPGKPV